MKGILSLLLISLLCNCAFSKALMAKTESICEYDGPFSGNFTPWTALIRLKRQKFVAAIINNTTLLTTGASFRDPLNHKFKMNHFADYTIQIGLFTTGNKHLDHVQILQIAYVKPHPELPVFNLYWPNFWHDWVIVYLKEPVNFTSGVGPICLPTVPQIRKILRSSPATVANLTDVLIHGTTGTSVQSQVSYYMKLKSNDDCQRLWQLDRITSKFPYRNRVCGNISQPATDNACIHRRSGAVLAENQKWYLIGFQNLNIKRKAICDETKLIYVSLLMPEDLEWLHDNLKCGPDKFSCDNGTKCLDLKSVCDGKTRHCVDGSDQNSVYCDGLSKCSENQFTCSKGLAAYCIPTIDSMTGKVARNCDKNNDCPGGEDEDAILCATKFPMIWVYIAVCAFAFVTTSFSVTLAVYSRRSRRDLTLEELIDFFEGERHLQVESHATEIATDGIVSEGANGDVVHENETPMLPIRKKSSDEIIEPSDLVMDFCPESVRAKGYDKSSDFDVGNPNECTLGLQIGSGSFGIIKKGFVHGKAAAIKYPNISIEVNAFKVLLLELKILKYIRDAAGEAGHPNIVRFIGADTRRVRKRILYVALEYCENGNMQDYIGINRSRFKSNICGPPTTCFLVSARGPSYSKAVIQDSPIPTPYPLHSECLQRLIHWAEQIAAGMNFLSNKILHLDLAARNVLLDSNLVAKVGDFGLSRKVYENITYKIKRKDPLPFQWLALEILTTHKCSRTSDIWSFGVTIWELFSLCEEPWEGTDHCELAPKLCNGQRLIMPKYANLAIYEQMLACWNEQPDQRPSFGELETFFHNLIPG